MFPSIPTLISYNVYTHTNFSTIRYTWIHLLHLKIFLTLIALKTYANIILIGKIFIKRIKYLFSIKIGITSPSPHDGPESELVNRVPPGSLSFPTRISLFFRMIILLYFFLAIYYAYDVSRSLHTYIHISISFFDNLAPKNTFKK